MFDRPIDGVEDLLHRLPLGDACYPEGSFPLGLGQRAEGGIGDGHLAAVRADRLLELIGIG